MYCYQMSVLQSKLKFIKLFNDTITTEGNDYWGVKMQRLKKSVGAKVTGSVGHSFGAGATSKGGTVA